MRLGMVFILGIGFVLSSTVVASPSNSPNTTDPATEVPQNPSAPQQLTPNFEIPPFDGCHREFSVRGVKKAADSYYRRDCENLRPLLSRDPASLFELNAYQETRREVTKAAYIGTAGLAILIGGVFGSQFITNHDEAKNAVRLIGLLGGTGLILGGATYAYITLSHNEARIHSAVQHYNQSYPESKIQLNFSSEELF